MQEQTQKNSDEADFTLSGLSPSDRTNVKPYSLNNILLPLSAIQNINN